MDANDEESSSGCAGLVVFGEVLFDCFPDGRRTIGGAPFNVAWGLKGLGRDPLFVSAIGEDRDGASVRTKMKDWGLRTAGLQKDPRHATGEVRISLDAGEPSYEICEPRAWDFIADQGYRSDGIIYHGLLALRNARSRATLEAMLERSSAKRFFDINLRPPYDSLDLLRKWVRNAEWLKLNLDELEYLLGERGIEFSESEAHIDRLRAEFSVRNVLLTGGSAGALISGAYGRGACMPAPEPDPMVDTVGAGDSFSAVTIHGILGGMSADAIVAKASAFAARVCGMQGATSGDRNFYQ